MILKFQNRWNGDSATESIGIAESESELENLGADFQNRPELESAIPESDSRISAGIGKASCDDTAHWQYIARIQQYLGYILYTKDDGNKFKNAAARNRSLEPHHANFEASKRTSERRASILSLRRRGQSQCQAHGFQNQTGMELESESEDCGPKF